MRIERRHRPLAAAHSLLGTPRMFSVSTPEIDGTHLHILRRDELKALDALSPQLRRLSIYARPPHREAEEWANVIGDALERNDALEELSVHALRATGPILRRVARRPWKSLDTDLAAFEALEDVDPKSLRALRLSCSFDDYPFLNERFTAWLTRFHELEELHSPLLEASALDAFPRLERLRSGFVIDLRSQREIPFESVLAHLPKPLRELAIPYSGDALVAAFGRCPDLTRVHWTGCKLSAAGARALVASGALERVTEMELNGALERKEARYLFERGHPFCLKNLSLAFLELRDSTIQVLAKNPSWLARLERLDVSGNELSDRGLAALLEVVNDVARDLVALSVDRNRPGPAAFELLRRLQRRGVAIDVPIPPSSERSGQESARMDLSPAERVTHTLERLDRWIEREGRVPNGFGEAPSPSALERARHLPPSLRALYAAYDLRGGNELIADRFIRCWPLAVIAGEAPIEVDERTLFVFGYQDAGLDETSYEDGEEEPTPDDDLDVLWAVDAATEEVVTITRKHGVAVAADELAVELDKVVTQLESGAMTIGEDGVLTTPSLATSEKPRLPAVTPSLAFVTALLARGVVELREGITAEVLANALEAAARTSDAKTRRSKVLAVFESDLVDEIFAGDDELEAIAKMFAREFA